MAEKRNLNTLWGFLAIGVIMVGFLFLQSNEAKKQAEYQQKVKARNELIALNEARQAQARALLEARDSANVVISAESTSAETPAVAPVPARPTEVYTLENELLALEFVSAGAQPRSARIKNYTNYGGSDLYLFRDFALMKDSLAAPAKREYNLLDFTAVTYSNGRQLGKNNWLHTANLDFVKVDSLSNGHTLVMAAEYAGGEILQTWNLAPDTYQVGFNIAFHGLQDVLSTKVSSMKLDYKLAIPRMERGLRNEKQYSKINYKRSSDGEIEDLGGAKDVSETEGASIAWVGYQQQFFSVILHKTGEPFSRAEKIEVKYKEENDPDHRLMDCSSRLVLPYDGGSEDVSMDFQLYMGPNDYYGLKEFGEDYEKVIPLGGWLVGWFTKWVIIPMFRFFHDNLGILNFGIIILLMTVVIKLIVLPLAYKSYSSSAKMSALRPEMEKINAKFPKQEDAMKKQQATMDLYRRAGVSPMGGCLPMLLQFPILWAMFRFFPASIELRQQGFLWCDDLSTYDNILPAGFELPLIGHLSLFALLMAVSMWFYSKVISTSQTAANDPSAKMMKFMSLWMMPIMMFFICNSLSAGLSYYYLLSNLITMLETWIIRKWFVKPDEILAKVHASEGKPVQKSKWQLRLEEAQKMQRQMEQQKKNQGRR